MPRRPRELVQFDLEMAEKDVVRCAVKSVEAQLANDDYSTLENFVASVRAGERLVIAVNRYQALVNAKEMVINEQR